MLVNIYEEVEEGDNFVDALEDLQEDYENTYMTHEEYLDRYISILKTFRTYLDRKIEEHSKE